MAFIMKNFQPIGGQSRIGDAPQIWSYKTEDTAATVDTAGYFNAVHQLLRVGDVILRLTTSSGAVSTVGWHVVLTIAAGVVDTSDTTALTLTDTD